MPTRGWPYTKSRYPYPISLDLETRAWVPEGEPQLRDSVGALHTHRARKGVFITTGEFMQKARQYVERVDFKISLIDGERLADLMLDFTVGVSRARTTEIKRIDNDYFAEG